MSAHPTTTSDTALRVTLEGWRGRVREELDVRVLPFWLAHGLDGVHGGYLDHLDRCGEPFDSKKHVGLQAQALWVWSRLVADSARRPEWFAAARSGAEFLRAHARDAAGRAYAMLTADGRPVAPSCGARDDLFLAAALAEWARACGEDDASAHAREALDAALAAARESGRPLDPTLSGALAASDLDTVVLALDALQSHARLAPSALAAEPSYWIERAKAHVRPELDLVLEHVALDGALLDGPEGRLVCPGRALVAARQLFEHARRARDESAVEQALAALESVLDFGWDCDDGGLYLYLDRDGLSPVQIEWSRKLAWVHGAALVATLSAYTATRAPRWLERFEQIADYTLTHFPDPNYGEWFASLDRRNRVAQRFKAGPRKGGYAVARALLHCDRLFGELLA